MWCLYPNKSAVLESVQNAFGQEPVANDEVTAEKVYFDTIKITVFLIVDLQVILVILSVLESWACDMYHEGNIHYLSLIYFPFSCI